MVQILSIHSLSSSQSLKSGVDSHFCYVLLAAIVADLVGVLVNNHVMFLIVSELIVVKNNFIVQTVERSFQLDIGHSETSVGNIINLVQIDSQAFEKYGFASFQVI